MEKLFKSLAGKDGDYVYKRKLSDIITMFGLPINLNNFFQPVGGQEELNFNEFDEFEPEEVSDSNEKKSEEQAKRTSLTKRFSSISNVSSLLEDAAKKAIKHFKYSVGMLQNDFSIDEQSATKLMNKLKNIGVVGSPDSDGFYPVLIDSEAVLTFKLSWSAE